MREREAVVKRMAPALWLLGIGWYFALSIVGGVVAGLVVDGWFGSKPLFTVLGLFAGLLVAFWGGYKLLMQVMSNRSQEKGVDEA